MVKSTTHFEVTIERVGNQVSAESDQTGEQMPVKTNSAGVFGRPECDEKVLI